MAFHQNYSDYWIWKYIRIMHIYICTICSHHCVLTCILVHWTSSLVFQRKMRRRFLDSCSIHLYQDFEDLVSRFPSVFGWGFRSTFSSPMKILLGFLNRGNTVRGTDINFLANICMAYNTCVVMRIFTELSNEADILLLRSSCDAYAFFIR